MRSWWVWVGAPWRVLALLVLLTAAGAVSTVPRAGDWLGSWKQALSTGTGASVFIGPVAAGVACLVYARLRSSAMSEVILQSRRDLRCWLQPLLGVWGLACGALGVVSLATTTLAALAGAPAYPQYWWVVPASFGVLAAQVALGAAIGYASARAWLAPVAVVLVFLLFLWTVVGPVPAFFTTGGATASLAGQRFAPAGWTALGLAGLALAVVILAAAMLAARQHRLLVATWPRRAGVAAALVGWLAGWFVVGDADRLLATEPRPALTCAGSDPEVCLFAETPRPLDDLAAKVDRQAAALQALGVPVPARFADVGTDWAAHRGGVVVLLDEYASPTVGEDRATDTLVRPAACAADFGDEPPFAAFDARYLLGRWLQVRAGVLEPAPDAPDRAWLRSAEADAWVSATYRRLGACAFEEIRMPDGLG